MPLFEEARANINRTTRRGLALYFGSINLAGETVTNPAKWLRGIERRGERVLKQIENNNRQVRRSLSLLQRRTNETASSVRGTARATVGLASTMANDVDAATPGRTRRGSTSRRRTTRSRVAAASGRTRSTATRATSRTRTAAARSQAAKKAVRTRAVNERRAELKKARTAAKARATRAAHRTETTLDRAQDRVQDGLQSMGQRLENVGERIERAVEQVAS